MASIRSNHETIMSSTTEQRMHEFPLSRRSLHDTEHNIPSTATRADYLARDVETLAQELSPSCRESAASTPETEISHDIKTPLLRKTAYREQHEKEFERSPEYLRIQLQILQHTDKLGTFITAQQAYQWTAKIAPKNQSPLPVQALRLCYYMRSFGLDTFAVVKPSRDPETGVDDTLLKLFVANPESEQRGLGHDYLYWVQRIGTGEVVVRPYDLQRLAESAVARRQLRIDIGPPLGDTINQAFQSGLDGRV